MIFSRPTATPGARGRSRATRHQRAFAAPRPPRGADGQETAPTAPLVARRTTSRAPLPDPLSCAGLPGALSPPCPPTRRTTGRDLHRTSRRPHVRWRCPELVPWISSTGFVDSFAASATPSRRRGRRATPPLCRRISHRNRQRPFTRSATPWEATRFSPRLASARRLLYIHQTLAGTRVAFQTPGSLDGGIACAPSDILSRA